MTLELSRFVMNDLDAIGEYLARDNPSRAESFVEELILEIERLTDNPFGFRIRPEYGPEARLAVYGAYVILFRILDEVVRVERVLHGARKLGRLYSESAKNL